MTFPTIRLFRGRPLESGTVLRATRDALSIAGVLFLLVALRTGGLPGYDFYAYWSVDPSNPYVIAEGFGNFHYPPPMAWLAGPLKLLPWPLAYWVWLGLMLLILVWLARDWALAWLAFPPVWSELYHGNIHILLAAALVLSLRWPVAYAFLALSKATTGITAVWWLARREWRPLVLALGATVVVGGLSFVSAPRLWFEWLGHIAAEDNVAPILIPIPLLARLPVAALIAFYAARTDRRGLLPIALALALPLLWVHGLAVLVAITPLVRASGRSQHLVTTAPASA